MQQEIPSNVDLKKFQDRLIDGIVYTLRVRDTYFTPTEFRRNLNAAIEGLRSSTWVLQKTGSAIAGFQKWYEQEQAKLRNDPLMRWLVDSRNRIVKEGDLEGKSTARIKIYRGWYSEPFIEVAIPPKTDPAEYAKALSLVVPNFAKIEEGLLRVDRRWVDINVPEFEVYSALEHCCKKLLALHDSISKIINIPANIDLGEVRANLLTENVQDYMGCWLKLQSGELVWSATKAHQATRDQYDAAKERYESSWVDEIDLPLHTPFQKRCSTFFTAAMTVLRVDGYALPFAFIFDEHDVMHQHALVMEDRAEKHIVFREVAQRAGALRARSVVVVNEAWMASAKGQMMHAEHRNDRTEGLLVQGVTFEGENFSIIQPFTRIEGKIFAHAKPSTQTHLAAVMMPIYEAISSHRS